MALTFKSRASDCAHVDQIGHASADSDSAFSVVPDGSWGLIVFHSEAYTKVYLTGSTTRPVSVALKAGDQILSVSFKPSSYIPGVSAHALLDNAKHLQAAASRSIWWNHSERFEVPTFENADDFVAALVRREQLVVNSAVAAVLQGHSPAMSPRSLQRHFLKTTGMTHNYWQQIQRARTAVAGLQLGKSLAQIALETGYVDQSHMTRWLKQIVGRTPGQIVRDSKPQR